MEISGSPGRRGNTFRSDTGGRRLRKPPRTGSRWFPRRSHDEVRRGTRWRRPRRASRPLHSSPMVGSAPMPLASGARLGPFEVLEPLGAGGMGEVYRARDSRLGRIVAVKVLRPDVAADPARIDRFEREARAASALNHPNIVTIHDVGVEGGTSYIAMEWVDGSPLRNLVTRARPQAIPTRRQPRRADRRRAGRGACRGHRPPRSQA